MCDKVTGKDRAEYDEKPLCILRFSLSGSAEASATEDDPCVQLCESFLSE